MSDDKSMVDILVAIAYARDAAQLATQVIGLIQQAIADGKGTVDLSALRTADDIAMTALEKEISDSKHVAAAMTSARRVGLDTSAMATPATPVAAGPTATRAKT